MVNEIGSTGRPPLCVAADYGHFEVIKYLIENGANINVSVMIQIECKQCYKSKIIFILQAVDSHGITPLLSAIYEGHKECVKLLLTKVRLSYVLCLISTSYFL